MAAQRPPSKEHRSELARQERTGGSGSARRGRAGGPPADQAGRLLNEGELQIEGRLRGASNTTLRGSVTLGDLRARCVYKPIAGERPLWDFPDGTLAGREVAAYLVSEATGWNIVPPTVLRDGPLGPGACQLWIDVDRSPAASRVGFVPAAALPAGWHPIADASDEDGVEYLLAHAEDEALVRIALLDVVINNADRKGGHVLTARDGTLRGVDHGVSFHVQDKLRTVLWGFAGRPIPEPEAAVLASLGISLKAGGTLRDRLCPHLAAEEIEATVARLDRLVDAGVLPAPAPGRHAMPWPPI